MLNDETARFSVKDIGLIVGFTAAFVFAFSNLKQADSKQADRMDAIDARIDVIKSANIPRRMDRLEYLICATEDPARQHACEQMGVFK